MARPETEVTLMRRVAVITEASRGIGAATALVLAERGFRVVVNYRSSAPQADEVVAAITAAGGEAVAMMRRGGFADKEQRYGCRPR
jgi:NAD(P)-dependent dehydrogenase (short-subunit alcohol dehydrogenase family)